MLRFLCVRACVRSCEGVCACVCLVDVAIVDLMYHVYELSLGCIFAVLLAIVVVLFVLNRRGHLQPPGWMSRNPDQSPIVPPSSNGAGGFDNPAGLEAPPGGFENPSAAGFGNPSAGLENPTYGSGIEVDSASA